MKIVFFGSPSSAVPSLEALASAGHDIALVVTQPDRPAGRSRRPRAPAVKEAAGRLDTLILQPAGVRGESFATTLEAVRPDMAVVVAYGKILPRRVLEVPRLGSVNLHFSLLPAYRGAAPVQWSLANGDEKTGVTTMRIVEALDAGDILLQRAVPVLPGEHAPALTERLAALGAPLLVETLSGLAGGTLVGRPQDHAEVTTAPRLTPEDGEADFSLTARQIEGRVRGFDPWPGFWVRRRGRRVRLVEAEAMPDETTSEPPGLVLPLRTGGLRVACARGTVLAVRAVKPEGRGVVDARDAVNGRQIEPGDMLS